ncbi:MAG TPA: glycerol kinase GlpK [Candidatus Merdivicinus intestinigallinarum]|nr:glycerol kinase GlpK [Candidatus Merdivicinus intestinigallinarum]
MKKYMIALDQGTTSSRAVIFDRSQRIINIAQREYTQYYPKEGWVEHDPMEIYASQYGVLIDVLLMSGIQMDEVAAIGITNQRETTIVWEKKTGRPVCNAIVWQCRRTAAICEQLKADGYGDLIRERTGLLPDAYFSGTKIKWILDNVPDAREKAERGELLFGTVDSWLIWKLTGGLVHATDYTNASRTMLFNIHTLQWDEEILKLLDIPRQMLPEVKPSSGVFGMAQINGYAIPIAGVAGDQQAALFGQACFREGEAKNTYGTGCFLLMNTGSKPIDSKTGLITTIAASQPGEIQYALEGSVFTGGSVVQWLRDEMRFITDSSDSDYYASKVPDTGGVYMVPAFTGLGAPHWDMFARGMLIGITRGTGRSHIIRAALESIAYQSNDVLDAIQKDAGIDFSELKVDGGASANEFLMQFQADIIGKPVVRPSCRETTALGAAYLAGLAVHFWEDLEELRSLGRIEKVFTPAMESEKRERLLKGWQKAVTRAQKWAEIE